MRTVHEWRRISSDRVHAVFVKELSRRDSHVTKNTVNKFAQMFVHGQIVPVIRAIRDEIHKCY